MDDARAHVAKREAKEYRRTIMGWFYIMLGIYGIVLGAIAFFHVGVEWLLVAGFLFGTFIICQIVIDGIARLDAGRAYLEQVCHDMNERLAKMHWQMS